MVEIIRADRVRVEIDAAQVDDPGEAGGEASFKAYTSRLEDKIWKYTLAQVAQHFGVTEPEVVMETTLVDKRRQWDQMGNIWKNSAIRTLLRRDRRS